MDHRRVAVGRRIVTLIEPAASRGAVAVPGNWGSVEANNRRLTSSSFPLPPCGSSPSSSVDSIYSDGRRPMRGAVAVPRAGSS